MLLKLRQPVTLNGIAPVSLHDLCHNTIDEWKSGRQPEHEILLDMLEDIKTVSINADSFRLSQALTNLLNNAAEHTPSSGVIEFRVDLAPTGEARIRIIDEGEGIPPKHVEEVFNPLYTSRREGTGLGLNLVKRIVEQHDGCVSLCNNDGCPGCTAEVLLPLDG